MRRTKKKTLLRVSSCGPPNPRPATEQSSNALLAACAQRPQESCCPSCLSRSVGQYG